MMTPKLADDQAITSLRNPEIITSVTMRGKRLELPAEPILLGIAIIPMVEGLNLNNGSCCGWEVLHRRTDSAINQRPFRRLSLARRFARRIHKLSVDWTRPRDRLLSSLPDLAQRLQQIETKVEGHYP